MLVGKCEEGCRASRNLKPLKPFKPISAMKKEVTSTLLVAIFAIVTCVACTRKLSLQSIPPDEITDTVLVNDVTTKILKSFHATYGEVPTVKWSRSENGFAASFKYNGMNNIIYYRLDGSVESEIHSYFEGQLPQAIRSSIKSRFYDFTISHVTEVKKNGMTAYFVKIEDATSIKTVKVMDEELEVVETLVKR